MAHIGYLEKHIRESYTLIQQFEALRLYEGNPREKHRHEQEIEGQWTLIAGYLGEYIQVCGGLYRAPEDIRQIAAHFPQLIVGSFGQAYAALRREVPESAEALDQLAWVLRELGHLHAQLNEWKELHHLLQDCIPALTNLKTELESALEQPTRWKKVSGRRQWDDCLMRFNRLEFFAQNIKYIAHPLYRDRDTMQGGPFGMITIISHRDTVSACLMNADPAQV